MRTHHWLVVAALALAMLTAALALLPPDNRSQALAVLVWLPLLLCPLMHLFMHRHGKHS